MALPLPLALALALAPTLALALALAPTLALALALAPTLALALALALALSRRGPHPTSLWLQIFGGTRQGSQGRPYALAPQGAEAPA